MSSLPRTSRKHPSGRSKKQAPAAKKAFSWRTVFYYLRLIVCFPLGLYVLWTRAQWPRAAKTALSIAVAALLLAVLLPLTNPPERAVGGIHLVEEDPESEMQGPAAPADRQVIEIYAPRYTSIILQPTATPPPIMVFCNDGGKNYHSADCRYVRPTTPDVTLEQAIAAGYTQCPECDAPSPY